MPSTSYSLFCLYAIRAVERMMEWLKQTARQRMGTKIDSAHLPPQGRSNTVLLFRCSGGCCGGSIATAVEKRKVHDVSPYPVQCRQRCHAWIARLSRIILLDRSTGRWLRLSRCPLASAWKQSNETWTAKRALYSMDVSCRSGCSFFLSGPGRRMPFDILSPVFGLIAIRRPFSVGCMTTVLASEMAAICSGLLCFTCLTFLLRYCMNVFLMAL